MTKYLTKKELVRINQKSIEENRNRTLEPSKISELDDKLLFPVIFGFVHNDVEMRASIGLAENISVFLDMSFDDFNKLPIKMKEVTHATSN